MEELEGERPFMSLWKGVKMFFPVTPEMQQSNLNSYPTS